jgi:hypothetical protein
LASITTSSYSLTNNNNNGGSTHHLNNHHRQPLPQHTTSASSASLASLSGLNLSASSSTLSPSGTSAASRLNFSTNGGSISGIGSTYSSALDGLALGGVTTAGLNLSNSSNTATIGGTADLGMSHWINDSSVKSEHRSPGIDATTGSTNLGGIGSSHLDTTIFCTNPSIDTLQNSNAYDHKQDYYNYYNR